MKRFCFRILIVVLLVCIAAESASAAALLIPVGKTIGLELRSAGVTVVAFQGEGESPGELAGLTLGDVILKAGDLKISTPEDLQKAVRESRGALELTIRRKGETRQLSVDLGTQDLRKLGIFVRDGITGIGTVTYYDSETGRFGALGHGVNSAEGELLPMEGGTAMRSTIVDVKRGKAGKPGQLRGAFSREDSIGELTANTNSGLFGKSDIGWAGEPLPVADHDEVKTGSAEIFSNISGTEVRKYQVEILKLYPSARANGRNILLQVTDKTLLEKTGGIVQGMSGSPIVQNGKLVGAVTHVLVNDPTTGYGIFIENMLNAAA